MRTLTFRAMGCSMLAAMDEDSPRAAERLASVPKWFEAWEQHLSRFRPDSELNCVNLSAGNPVQLSETMWEVLQAALKASQQSQGLVMPTLLQALENAGYDRSFEALADGVTHAGQKNLPTNGQLKVTLLDEASRTIQLTPGTRLDFGGVAKGWAARQAMQRLQAYAPALVNAGGDIAISGLQLDGEPWPVGVDDPMHPDAQLVMLKLGRCGVATSGRDYRRWQKNGAWQHHIIDSRTGQPAETDVLSATVIAPDVRQAEMASKTVLILGSQAGLAWLEAQASLAGMLVLEDGQGLQDSRFEKYIWR